jgi:hypothetical protein
MHAASASRSFEALAVANWKKVAAQRPRDVLSSVERAAPADASERDASQAAGVIEHRLHADASSHRVPQVVGHPDVEMVEQPAHVGGHDVHRVGGGVVGLVAGAVATAVETHDAKPGLGQRLLPACSDPVQLIVGGEAVHEDDGRAILRSMQLVVQSDAVAVEVHSRLRLP